MARDEHGDDGDRAEASHGPQECMPCRGTGRVISNLGGAANTIPCPWCGGDGVRKHDLDAQAHWAAGEVGASEGAVAAEAEAEPAGDAAA